MFTLINFSEHYNEWVIMQYLLEVVAWGSTLSSMHLPSNSWVEPPYYACIQISQVEMPFTTKIGRWRSTIKRLCKGMANPSSKFVARTLYNCRYYFWVENCIFTQIAPHTFCPLYGMCTCTVIERLLEWWSLYSIVPQPCR